MIPLFIGVGTAAVGGVVWFFNRHKPSAFVLARAHEAKPIDPLPEWYAEVWELVRECLGLEGDFKKVRWWMTEYFMTEWDQGGQRVRGPQLGVEGTASRKHRCIILRYDHVRNRRTVAHEIAHYLRGDETPEHDESVFIGGGAGHGLRCLDGRDLYNHPALEPEGAEHLVT